MNSRWCRAAGPLLSLLLAAPVPADDTDVEPTRALVLPLVARSAAPHRETVAAAVRDARSLVAIAAAVDPLVGLRVRINPEGRVKLEPGRPFPRLVTGRPHPFLIEVTNDAGITAALTLVATDQSLVPPRRAAFCVVGFVAEAAGGPRLSGAAREWKLATLTLTEPGRREVRLEADAGQGTQDLGFRATTDLLLSSRPAAGR